MSNKLFSERLNTKLDEIGMPERADERIENFGKFIEIPKTKAERILDGREIPNTEQLNFLAKQLEVSVDWLLGKD